MGFLSNWLGKIDFANESIEEKYERCVNHAVFGSAFMTIGELYGAFERLGLADDTLLTFSTDNPDSAMPALFGGAAGVGCYFNDDIAFPEFAIDQRVDSPLYYGELMDLLRRKGEQWNWERYPYRCRFYYRIPPYDNDAVPYYPSIVLDPENLSMIDINGEDWYNAGSGGHNDPDASAGFS